MISKKIIKKYTFNYSQDSDKQILMNLYNRIDRKLLPKTHRGSEERQYLSNVLEELDYFINLKERDEDLENRGIK